MNFTKTAGKSFSFVLIVFSLFLIFMQVSSATFNETFGTIHFTNSTCNNGALNITKIQNLNNKISDYGSNSNYEWYKSLHCHESPIIQTINSTYVKTSRGILLDLDSTGIGDDFMYGGIVHIFDQPFYLNTNFLINFYTYYNTGAIIFWTGENSGLIAGMDSTTSNLGSRYGGSWTTKTGCFQSNSALVYQNITKDSLQGLGLTTGCNFTNYNLSQEFVAIGFYGLASNSASAQNDFIIDDFTMTNYSTTGNELPTYTLEYNNSIFCINDTTQDTTFNFNLTATDTEGDIIYYSTTQAILYNATESEDFTEQNCKFQIGDYGVVCSTQSDLSFQDKTIASTDFENLTIAYQYSDMGFTKYGLIMPTNALINYDLGKAYDNLRGGIEYALSSSGGTFNLSLKSADLSTQFANVEVTLNGSNVDIKKQGVNLLTYVYDDEKRYGLAIGYKNDTHYYLISTEIGGSVALSSYQPYETELTVFKPSVITIKDTAGVTFLYKIEYYGLAEQLTWTTTKPTSVTYDETGTYEYNIYISDDVHYSTPEYVKAVVPVTIYPSNKCFPPSINTNPISAVMIPVWSGLLDATGMKDTLRSVFWLGFVVLMILSYVVSWDLLVSLKLSSLGILMIAVFTQIGIGYTIGSFVLLAFSFVPDFIGLFWGGGVNGR